MKKMKDDDSGGAGLGSDFLGPSYKYQDFIKSTDEMGMSGAGNFTALGNDIAGIISYSGLLIEGGGKARKGGPLGNRFFTKTGTKCQPSKKVGGKWKPIKGEGKVARYLAGKASIAVRIDHFNGEPWTKEEVSKIHKEAESIKDRFPKPPKRK